MHVGEPLYGLSMAIITAIRIGTSFVMAQWISIVCCCIANKQILWLCLLLPEQLNAANHKGMLQVIVTTGLPRVVNIPLVLSFFFSFFPF